jgi:preprotein translocase subunit SecG
MPGPLRPVFSYEEPVLIYASILAIHLIICVGLVLAVLLQAGKGGGLAGAFGASGGAAQTLFGGRGAATFLSKATTVLGIAFMTTSLTLALLAGARSGEHSVIRETRQEAPGTAPPVTSEPLQVPGGSDAFGLPGEGAATQGAPGLETGKEAPGTAPGAAPPQNPAPAGGQQPAPAGSPPQNPPQGGGGNWRYVRKWRNWQTRKVEGLVGAIL